MLDAAPSISSLHLVILIPLRDDRISAAELIRRLDQAIAPNSYVVDILLVDDGSIQDYCAADFPVPFSDPEKHTDTSSAPESRSPAGHRRRLGPYRIGNPMRRSSGYGWRGEDTPEGVLCCCTLFRENPPFLLEMEPANGVYYVPNVLSPVQYFPFLPYRRARTGWKLQHSIVRLSANAPSDARAVDSLCRPVFRLPAVDNNPNSAGS